MGETLPEEPGEYSVLYGGSAMPHPGLPEVLEPAASNPCKFNREHRRGRDNEGKAESPAAWSVLILSPGPHQDLVGCGKRDTDPRECGEGCILAGLKIWGCFLSRTSEAMGVCVVFLQCQHRTEAVNCKTQADRIREAGVYKEGDKHTG